MFSFKFFINVINEKNKFSTKIHLKKLRNKQRFNKWQFYEQILEILKENIVLDNQEAAKTIF